MMAITWTDRAVRSPWHHQGAVLRQQVGEALVHRAASRAGVGRVQVVRSARGQRPTLNVPGLHYSVAHSGSLSACVLADGNVGLDLEDRGHPREQRIRPAALHRFLTGRERAIIAQDPGRLPEVFTRKEAWAKYTGSGLAIGLGSIDVEQIQQDHPHVQVATFDLASAVCSVWFSPEQHQHQHPAPIRVQLTGADVDHRRRQR